MMRVVIAQANAPPTVRMSPNVWRGSSAGVGNPNATNMPANDRHSPIHCQSLNRSAGRKMRAPSTTKNGARYRNNTARVAVVKARP